MWTQICRKQYVYGSKRATGSANKECHVGLPTANAILPITGVKEEDSTTKRWSRVESIAVLPLTKYTQCTNAPWSLFAWCITSCSKNQLALRKKGCTSTERIRAFRIENFRWSASYHLRHTKYLASDCALSKLQHAPHRVQHIKSSWTRHLLWWMLVGTGPNLASCCTLKTQC